MSISYWTIEGVGIDVSDIEKAINKEKLVRFMAEQMPDEEEFTDIINCEDYAGFDMYEYFYGNPFENLGDVLTHCDDTDSLTFGDDGESGVYFYYPPSMPWWRTDNEPETLEDVYKRIISAVQKITDLTAEEIRGMIRDDLYIVGCG